jgi:hypothetical protein
MDKKSDKYEYSCGLCGARFRGHAVETVVQRATAHQRGHMDGREELSRDDVDLIRARVVFAKDAGTGNEIEEQAR